MCSGARFVKRQQEPRGVFLTKLAVFGKAVLNSEPVQREQVVFRDRLTARSPEKSLAIIVIILCEPTTRVPGAVTVTVRI